MQTERTKLLKEMLAERKSAVTVSYEELLLHDVAKKTEGFAARDLKAVADRAVYAHFINNRQHSSCTYILPVFSIPICPDVLICYL